MVNNGMLLAVVVLVAGASLASFALSQWFARAAGKSRGWIAIAVCTVLLLTAATIVTLTTDSHALRPWANIDPASPPDTSQFPSAHQDTDPVAQPSLRDQNFSYDSTPPSATEPVRKYEPSSARSSPVRPDASPADLPAARSLSRTMFNAATIWDATDCVRAFHRDPENLVLWTLENECGVPVAIVIAACSSSPPQCDQQRGWEYRRGGMLLPAKHQRTVTDREENQDGRHLRYAACRLTTQGSVRLVGTGTSADDSWLDSLELARTEDPCLSRAYDSTSEGLGRGVLTEALVRYGTAAPRDD